MTLHTWKPFENLSKKTSHSAKLDELFAEARLDASRDISPSRDECLPPLAYCILYNNPHLVKALVDRGAQPTQYVRTDIVGASQLLVLAVRKANAVVLQEILNHVSVEDLNSSSYSSSKYRDMFTLVQFAARRVGSVAKLRILVDAGAKVKPGDFEFSLWFIRGIPEILLNSGADPFHVFCVDDEYEITASVCPTYDIVLLDSRPSLH